MSQDSQIIANKPDWNVQELTYCLVNQNPDIVIVTDLKGDIEYINNAVIQETGEEPRTIVGKNLSEWLTTSFGQNIQYKYFLNAIESGKSWSGTFYKKTMPDKGKWEQVNTSPVIFDKDKSTHMTITIKNISKEKILAEELRKNKRQDVKKIIDNHDSKIIELIESEERERKRFASDLHDGIGQILTAAKYCLEGLEEVIPLRYEDEYKICCELLGSAISEARNISHGLMPSSLAEFGLIIALDDLCKHALLITGRPIRFEYNDKENLNLEAFKEMMIFRIAQECINNIQKHAGASQATISLKSENDQVVLTISDNGLGFEPNNATQGFGLLSIRNRTKLLGGCCNIKSEIGKGTQIRVSFHYKTS